MTGVDMDGDILSPLLSAPVWDDTLCFFFISICPQVNNAIEPAAMIPFYVLEKKLLQEFFCWSVPLAVVGPLRDVHLLESVRQTAQVKAKPEITGCTFVAFQSAFLWKMKNASANVVLVGCCKLSGIQT